MMLCFLNTPRSSRGSCLRLCQELGLDLPSYSVFPVLMLKTSLASLTLGVPAQLPIFPMELILKAFTFLTPDDPLGASYLPLSQHWEFVRPKVILPHCRVPRQRGFWDFVGAQLALVKLSL